MSDLEFVFPNFYLSDYSINKSLWLYDVPSLCHVQQWINVGRTLGQVFLGQLAAIHLHSLDNVETRAHCLALTGKYLRLQAVQKDPLYASALWDRHEQVVNTKVDN